jgi:hypothetical protein
VALIRHPGNGVYEGDFTGGGRPGLSRPITSFAGEHIKWLTLRDHIPIPRCRSIWEALGQREAGNSRSSKSMDLDELESRLVS